jgi:hypothetical protein
MHKIMAKRRIGSLRVLLHLEFLVIDADELLPLTRMLAKAVVGDSVKPSGKPRLSAETAEVFVSAQKSLLREIVGQREVGSAELAEQTSHA